MNGRIDSLTVYIYKAETCTNILRYNIHVCQAILETGSGRKLSHNGCTAGNFDPNNQIL
jgi:flagellum-specific peptidoglycan hydrolase FlgJ